MLGVTPAILKLPLELAYKPGVPCWTSRLELIGLFILIFKEFPNHSLTFEILFEPYWR